MDGSAEKRYVFFYFWCLSLKEHYSYLFDWFQIVRALLHNNQICCPATLAKNIIRICPIGFRFAGLYYNNQICCPANLGPVGSFVLKICHATGVRWHENLDNSDFDRHFFCAKSECLKRDMREDEIATRIVSRSRDVRRGEVADRTEARIDAPVGQWRTVFIVWIVSAWQWAIAAADRISRTLARTNRTIPIATIFGFPFFSTTRPRSRDVRVRRVDGFSR